MKKLIFITLLLISIVVSATTYIPVKVYLTENGEYLTENGDTLFYWDSIAVPGPKVNSILGGYYGSYINGGYYGGSIIGTKQ